MKNIFSISLIVLLIISLTVTIYYFEGNITKIQVSEIVRKDSPDKFKEYFSSIKKGDESNENLYPIGYKEKELLKMKKNLYKKSLLRSSIIQKDNNNPNFGTSSAATATFTERGPTNVPGRTRAIVVDAADNTGSTWYAAAVGGGVWKTSDSGTTWTSLSQDLENIAVSSLAQSAANPSILYAGTGESWVGNFDAIDGSGVFKSTNGGLNWSNVSPNTSGIVDDKFYQVSRVIASPSSADIVIASTLGPDGYSYIFKSSDGGSTWTEAKKSAKRIQQVIAAPTSFDTIYAAVRGGNALKSVDAGTTWNDLPIYSSSVSGSFNRAEIAVSHNTSNILYSALEGISSKSHVFVSFDGGSTWTEAANEDGTLEQYLQIFGWYANTIAVHPYNDSIFYTGSVDIYKSKLTNLLYKNTTHLTDGYNEIDTLNNDVHVDHHFLTIIKDGGGKFRILNGNDGGVALTKSSTTPGEVEGDFILERTSGYNTSQAYGADKVKGKNQYISGFQDNGTWLSPSSEVASSSTDYSKEIGGDGFEVITHWNNPDSMIGGAQGNYLFRSLDGGSKWYYIPTDEMREFGPFLTRLSTSYQDPDVVYAISQKGVHKSENFGGSWKTTEIVDDWGFLAGSDVEVSQANPRFVWAGGRMKTTGTSLPGKIFVSKDWGKTFLPTSVFEEIGSISGLYSHPTEDSTAYVLFSVFGKAKIIETKNLGATWNDITGFPANNVTGVSSNGFPNVGVYSLVVMPFDSDVIWAGTDIGLVESTDRGATWNLVDSNLPNVSIWDMKIKDQGEIVIATHGRGVWTASIPALSSFVPKTATLQPELLGYNQPGPEYKIDVRIDFKSEFDSVLFKTGSTLLHTISTQNSIGIDTVNITFNDAGTFPVTATGYKNGLNYSSNTLDIIIGVTLDVSSEYGTNFSDMLGNEFTLDGFTISSYSGFSGDILHTQPHPYQNAGSGQYLELFATLNTPIIVSNYTPSIKFREVAIVEIGEAGTSYGDAEFWDYVIVEASKYNQNSWKPLVDGYDSNAHSDWLSAYASDISATSSMLKDREIEFTPTFSVGDTVKLRFRLYSDPYTVGWGWAIDDLYVQMDKPVVSGVEDVSINKINVYPNPSTGVFNIQFNGELKGDVGINVFDIFGRTKYQTIFNNNSGYNAHKIDFSNNPQGIYILELNQNDRKLHKKLIIK